MSNTSFTEIDTACDLLIPPARSEADIRSILGEIGSWAREILADESVEDNWPAILAKRGSYGALGELLGRQSQADPKPLVLLLYEIDSSVGDTLIAVLRQLRAGYPRRPQHFPHSVLLCGSKPAYHRI